MLSYPLRTAVGLLSLALGACTSTPPSPLAEDHPASIHAPAATVPTEPSALTAYHDFSVAPSTQPSADTPAMEHSVHEPHGSHSRQTERIQMSYIPRSLKTWFLVGSAAVGCALLLVYLGVFNVAADVPHSALVFAAMELVRDRSIAVRSKDVQVPPLNDPKLVAAGAEHYAGMCVDCHLAPGAKESELRVGLYPQPPDLTARIDAGPAQMFWIVKHGIKMSAMPAWGKTHDDRSIWGIVAFLQRLPELSPEQYRALVDAQDDRHDPHSGAVNEHGHKDGHIHLHPRQAPQR